MKESCWIHEGKCLEEPPSDYYGFIYCITDDKGHKYWGKKAFTHKKKTLLSKKARVGTRKKYSYGTTDSKWLTYWGSSLPLLAYIKERGGTKGFKREIVKLCRDRQSLAYWETAFLIEEKVLFREDCWNRNVMSRFFKDKIHN